MITRLTLTLSDLLIQVHSWPKQLTKLGNMKTRETLYDKPFEFQLLSSFVHHPSEVLIFSLTNSLQNIVFTDYCLCHRNRGAGGACAPHLLKNGFCNLRIFAATKKFLAVPPPPPIKFSLYGSVFLLFVSSHMLDNHNGSRWQAGST